MNKESSLATEKAILQALLESSQEFNSTARRLTPANFANPVQELQIGRYRSLKSRICVSAEMPFIKQWIARDQEPPSFLEAGPRKDLYFDPAKVRIGIVTTGGIAPGLNTVIHSLVNMHSKIYRMESQAYGFLGDFRGLIEKRFIRLDPSITKEWIHNGGTGLATGRGVTDVETMVTRLEEIGIDILYVIGGEGSLTAAHLIAAEIQRRALKIVVAGVPKTMDNDILWVWHSFGFDTAVEEATKFINAMHEEAKSTDRICLMSLFGRDAGFVAAHAALASGQVDVVLVPEAPFQLEALLQCVQRKVQEKGYALIVAAEGACPLGYTEESVIEYLQKQGLDPTNRSNTQVSEALRSWKLACLRTSLEEHFKKFEGGGHGVFVQEPRYLVRAIPPNSVDQIYCQRLADLAVHNALAGFTDFMISQWLAEYVLVPLHLVAAGHKKIPPGGIFWTTVTSSTGQPSFD